LVTKDTKAMNTVITETEFKAEVSH